MKRVITILFSVIALFSSCVDYERQTFEPQPSGPKDKVAISFKVAVPGSGLSTKAMGQVPEIDNMYVAVFGGNGFFNEWVPATIQSATEANYDGTSATIYTVKVNLTISTSRLRLHFVANCPEKFKNNPPISGSSNDNLEDVVMSKLRSQITDSYNDAYWQKVILPLGVKASPRSMSPTRKAIPWLPSRPLPSSPIPSLWCATSRASTSGTSPMT